MSAIGSRSSAKKAKKHRKKTQNRKSRKRKREKKEKTVEAGVSRAQPPPHLEEARVKASPVARRVAAEFGVDLASVKGTGPEGRVTESDVRATAKSVAAVADRGKPGVQPKPALSIEAGEAARIQLSGMRRIIAQRMAE